MCPGLVPSGAVSPSAFGFPTVAQFCTNWYGYLSPGDVSAFAYVAVSSSDANCGNSATWAWQQVAQLAPGEYVCASDFVSGGDDSSLASNWTFGNQGYTVPFDISQIDTVQAGEAFAAAFVIVGMVWALGKAVGALLEVIRR